METWTESKIALEASIRNVEDAKSKLKEAEIAMEACKVAELMAYRAVPEDERELCLPDDVLRRIIERVITMCRTEGVSFDLSCMACVNKAWARSTPKFRVTAYDGVAIKMICCTLLFNDRAVDVRTSAVLATFEGTPALLPDGATLMLRNSEGITWRSLRTPPHHDTITISMKRILGLYPEYSTNTPLEAFRTPGITFTTESQSCYPKNVLINALNNTITHVNLVITDVDVKTLRLIGHLGSNYRRDLCYKWINNVHAYYMGESPKSSQFEDAPPNRYAMSPNQSHYLVWENHSVQVHRTIDHTLVDTLCPTFEKHCYNDFCIDDDNRIHVFSRYTDLWDLDRIYGQVARPVFTTSRVVTFPAI